MYDYEQGGGYVVKHLWCFIDAESPEAIERKFPELKVFVSQPEWMTDDLARKIKEARHFDIDAPGEWLLNLNRQR